MVEPQSVDFVALNQRALKSLKRAITFSNGEFSLVVVCCNYRQLQQQIVQQMLDGDRYLLQQVVLTKNTHSLYVTIHTQLAEASRSPALQPQALIISGLESVDTLDDLLCSINQVRDEFRKKHPFPMVLWVNERVLRKLRRLAPDFASWAATPIKFEMTTSQLRQFLQQQTDSLFATVLNVTRLADNFIDQWHNSNELRFAIRDLQNRGILLEPELNARLQFVFGLDRYVSDRMISALEHFQQSLLFWKDIRQEEGVRSQRVYYSPSPHPPLRVSPPETLREHHSPQRGEPAHGGGFTISPSPHLLQPAIVLLYMGLCYYHLAERNHGEHCRYWDGAKFYFYKSLETFEQAQRPDIVTGLINQLGEVLQHLQAWDELQAVAQKSLELHQTYGTNIQLAWDYGFLAEVATEHLNWLDARKFAQVSLFYLSEVNNNTSDNLGLFPLLWEQLYQLVLALALQHLGEEKKAFSLLDTASSQLDNALEHSDYRYNVHRYIRLLRRLRSLYYDSGRYLEAFCIRQKRRSVEQQYGLRAFIGAGRLQPQRQPTNPLMPVTPDTSVALEITASGRQQDINHLIGRISRADQKMTVIHGDSGVGKSSIVTAGLVPALRNRAIGDQIAVPVVLQIYTDWVRELGKSLGETEGTQPHSIAEILQKLQDNANNYSITVLIFDQFEEFFFDTNKNQLQQFDKFLADCLNIPFVKVIFSLREDYLHHLLEFKQLSALESVNNNILDKEIRYQLKNLSPDDAKSVIQKLTQRSNYYLQSALIDALVEDLSAELGEVRPIELQVVGAQLQDERITTIAKYQPFRPNKLIERYLKEIIKDCGAENARAALLILYLLTDENNKRPFKTKAELVTELTELEEVEKLELVLEILVRSGLVVLFNDVPERYQLIHDYLVDLIRYLQQAELNLQEILKQLRTQVQQRETEIARLQSELTTKKQQTKPVENSHQQGLDLLAQMRELRKREEWSRVEIERLMAEVEQQKLQAELAKTEKQRINEARLNRVLKMALAASVTGILALIISIAMALLLLKQTAAGY